MELKSYQQEVLNDLDAFMEQVEADGNLKVAYRNFWLKKGLDVNDLQSEVLHPYDNTVTGVPRVMLKVPTAGGKTFIACNALKTIFDRQPAALPRVVTWFVPSDSILTQTYNNLNNPQHPYRQRLDTLFNNAVQVVDKERALCGQGIQPNRINEQLTIFVLSVQSFAANNKDGRRVYRENSSLAEYADHFGNAGSVEGADSTSLIQAIAHLNPVVVIDESHNFEADLRLDMLNNINPRFILDLTATPRKKSNIISFVDAMKLKKANMVKLPVILYNRDSTEEVLIDAIQLQRNLERRALEAEKNNGTYIRPIVLLQAQPKSAKDEVTFDKIKESLIKTGIAEEQIKIKTADNNELKNEDLMSRDCPVRYIITVNALKEGWDCPFAYILASLANKTSKIEVEQILGRVLRLPYTIQHSDSFLNCSYVFTSSANFRETVESVIQGLNNAGFSGKDYRVAENTATEIPSQPLTAQASLFDVSVPDWQKGESFANASRKEEEAVTIDSDVVKQNIETVTVDSNAQRLNEILDTATQQNRTYEQENKNDDDNMPVEMNGQIKNYTIKEDFAEMASQMRLPEFKKKINRKSIFENEGTFVKLTKVMLSEGLNLENADGNIDFTHTLQEVVQIDLEQRNRDEYVPKQYQLNSSQLHAVRELFVGYDIENKRKQLTLKIARQLAFDEIHEPYISQYVARVLKPQSDEQLVDLFDNEMNTVAAFKKKMDGLILEYQKKEFKKLLDVGQVVCTPSYPLPKQLQLAKKAIGLTKGLYAEEGDMNGFEYKIIGQVANLDSVLFWHRNPERGKGFCMNGFINHYPDFIVRMRSGIVILIETKGDDRDNTDSRNKIELGAYWANKAGDGYRYFMVFDTVRLEGAVSVSELIERLKLM